MSNKIVITAHNISQKQWSTLLLELNLIKKAWRPVGVKLDLQAKNLKKIIHWGTKKYDEP
jgi:hypothetical protein|tara:strand:- start:2135 stop:2314 length:180 start_codon:yes stop_codon:yes gene_type:complete